MKSNSMLYSYVLILIFLPLILTGLNSCCTKRGCLGADQLDAVYLKNFAAIEVDSIFISSYKKDSDFKILTDSFMIERCDSFGNGNFYMFFNFKTIKMDNDYRIYFKKIDKVYQVKGFKTSKSECNDCFIKDYYKRLDGYEINDKFKSLGFIEIDKDFD